MIPDTATRRLRACISCSLLKSQRDFLKRGCENCPFLKMKDSPDAVLDATSDKFSGMLALASPHSSWLGKWQRIEGFHKGVYALTVEGELPPECVNAMEREGRTYYSRESSFTI
jgi:transcription elongation factor SPT4